LKRLATRRGRTEEEKVEHHFPAGGCLARNHLDVRGVGGGGVANLDYQETIFYPASPTQARTTKEGQCQNLNNDNHQKPLAHLEQISSQYGYIEMHMYASSLLCTRSISAVRQRRMQRH
jgi:hypothetical protein